MMSGSIQRLNSIPENACVSQTTQHSSAIAEIEVTVQSISFPENAHANNTNDTHRSSDKTELYLTTMFQFYQHIMDNFHSLLSRLQSSLYDSYGCVSIQPRVQGTLILRIHYRADRVVRLQCDQSSRELSQQIQEVLVTQEILDRLGVEDLQLSTEIQPFQQV